MGQRKPLSKKIRFEVFKRDSFTCQYCGKSAPDVVLEVDHINPVANGGDNDMFNLITSCKDCNRGKGKRTLSNNDELKIQKAKLDELNEKRVQMEMMVQWKKELQLFKEEQINLIEELIIDKFDCSLSEHGRNNIGKWISKFGFDEVYTSTEISVGYYNDCETAIVKIPGICYNRMVQKDNPKLASINKLIGIAKTKYHGMSPQLFKCKNFLISNFEETDYLSILELINESSFVYKFYNNLMEFYEGEKIGN